MRTHNNTNNNNHHDSSPMDNPKIKSTRRSRSSRRQSNSSSFVILRTNSKYHPATYILLLFPLLTILVPIKISLTQGDYNTAWGLIWALMFVAFVYMMVLPRTLDVRSDGSVGVKTSLMTYKFTDVVRAYEAPGYSIDDPLRPVIKFATDFKRPHTVAVRRRNGKWDLLVSPADVEDFIAAVNGAAADQDQNEATLTTDETGLRQDLSKQ